MASDWKSVAMTAWAHLEVILKFPPREFDQTFLDEITETVNQARALAGMEPLAKPGGE